MFVCVENNRNNLYSGQGDQENGHKNAIASVSRATGQANIHGGGSPNKKETNVQQTAATSSASDDNDELLLFCEACSAKIHAVDKEKVVWSSPSGGRSTFSFIPHILNFSIFFYLIFCIFLKFSRPKKIKQIGYK